MTSVATPLRGRGEEVGVTLPSWTQQGQKERGLRRGVPPLGSTSKRAKQGGGGDDTDREEEEAFGSGEGQGEGEVDKKHKSEKGTTGGKEKKIQEMEKQKQGKHNLQMSSVLPSSSTGTGQEPPCARAGGHSVFLRSLLGRVGS